MDFARDDRRASTSGCSWFVSKNVRVPLLRYMRQAGLTARLPRKLFVAKEQSRVLAWDFGKLSPHDVKPSLLDVYGNASFRQVEHDGDHRRPGLSRRHAQRWPIHVFGCEVCLDRASEPLAQTR